MHQEYRQAFRRLRFRFLSFHLLSQSPVASFLLSIFVRHHLGGGGKSARDEESVIFKKDGLDFLRLVPVETNQRVSPGPL